MKKILLVATMLAVCGFTLTAGGNSSRKNSTKLPIAEEYVMGNVSQAELSNTDFTMDVADADAVVLEEIIEPRIWIWEYMDDMDVPQYVYNRITRKIKILNDAGVRYATIEIPYYKHGDENVCIIDEVSGYIYSQANGEVVKTSLKLSDCKYERTNAKEGIMKIVFPTAKAGDVIEYSYECTESIKNNKLTDFKYGGELPILSSRYQIFLDDSADGDCSAFTFGEMDIKMTRYEYVRRGKIGGSRPQLGSSVGISGSTTAPRTKRNSGEMIRFEAKNIQPKTDGKEDSGVTVLLTYKKS